MLSELSCGRFYLDVALDDASCYAVLSSDV